MSDHVKRKVSLLHSGPWFNIKMSSYQYRKSHCGDKTILRSSYLHNGISYTGKMISLYWIRAQGSVTEELPATGYGLLCTTSMGIELQQRAYNGIPLLHSMDEIGTHWGRDKMATIFQMTFSNAFSWMKMYEFWLRFHWILFPRVQLTIFQHWLRYGKTVSEKGPRHIYPAEEVPQQHYCKD